MESLSEPWRDVSAVKRSKENNNVRLRQFLVILRYG